MNRGYDWPEGSGGGGGGWNKRGDGGWYESSKRGRYVEGRGGRGRGGRGRRSSHSRPCPREQERPTIDLNDPTLQPVKRDERYGTAGEETKLVVNSYNADFRTTGNLVFFHYDLSFEKVKDEISDGWRGRGRSRARGRGRGKGRGGSKIDDKPPPMPRCIRLIRKIEEQYASDLNNAKLAHDGKKNVYTSCDPGFGKNAFCVEDEGERIRVHFSLVSKISMGDIQNYISKQNDDQNLVRASVQCLDIIMRTQHLRLLSYTGKSFTMLPEPSVRSSLKLGLGCEMWPCFYQSFKAQDNGLYLSFDVSYNTFYTQQTVYDFAVELFSTRGEMDIDETENVFPNGLSSEQVNRLNNELRGILIEATYATVGAKQRLPRKIKRVTELSAIDIPIPDGPQETIAAHFEKIGEPLKYPHLQCLDLQSGKQGTTFIPLEKAKICPAQLRRKRMPAEMQGKMIRMAARDPLLRSNDIQAMLDKVSANTSAFMESFGVKIHTNAVTVPGRILRPPKLEFANGWIDVTDKETNDVSWSLKGQEFAYVQGEIENWGVLTLSDLTKGQVKKFVQAIITTGEKVGMKFQEPELAFGYKQTVVRDMVALYDKCQTDETKNGKNCQLLMVIKEDCGEFDYVQVKNIGETHLGIPTQCIVSQHAEEPKELYCQNVIMKMNAKLVGINWRIPIKSYKPFIEKFGESGIRTMILGISLSHPPKTGNNPDKCSIVTMVGSLDLRGGEWCGTYRTQEPTASNIRQVGDMIRDLLIEYHNRWGGILPQNLMIYRDGCAENQFAEIKSIEIVQIENQAAEIGQALTQTQYQPKISFIVLQKRHHTRFFPAAGEMKDIRGNCVPGTIVDRTIAHSINYDFYLISHNAVQGTARPVRYTMLKDDMNFDADEIQALTYHLCFTFCRSTKSVSIVPAVYYAGLLATRVRGYMAAREWVRELETAAAEEGGGGQDCKVKWYGDKVPDIISDKMPAIHNKLRRVLFYV